MSFSTANKKSNEYNEEHILFIGTHTGSFKRVFVSHDNPFEEYQMEKVNKLEKHNGITSLSSSNDSEKSQILLGREDGVVKVFENGSAASEWKLTSKIAGVCKYEDLIIAAEESGDIQICSSESPHPIETLQLSGDNISRMRQCVEAPNLVATGGNDRKNNLKIIDLTSKSVIFTSKNLPNDELDLEVPVWDTDLAFLSPNVVSTCSRHGYVRVYDTKQQRRPVLTYKNDKEQISYTTMVAHADQIFVGSNLGNVRAFDRRSMKTPVHTYKGFVGSVTSLSLDRNGKFFVAGCLDRYVRVFSVESPNALFQCYMKSKVTQVLLQDVKEEKEERVRIDNDPEYEEMFNNMQKIDDENEIPTTKKRKITENVSKKRIKS